MRIISVSANNFASYKNMRFNFIDQGLTLIQGPTGSGKSTLCDIIPWTVFGMTAKGGPVSDVLSWPGEEITQASVHLEVNNTPYVIRRSRGPKAKDNDLTYQEIGSEPQRGKDLLDTQKIINSRLGVDADLYLAGAYYHEFSQTAQFFTTTAKNRRAICEQLVDLSLANTLKVKLSEKYKLADINLKAAMQQSRDEQFRIEELKRSETADKNRSDAWETNHNRGIFIVQQDYKQFEASRKRIMKHECKACGTILAEPKEVVDTANNPYSRRLAEISAEINPFSAEIKDFSAQIKAKETALLKLDAEQTVWRLEQADMDLLQDIVQDYRSVSIRNTILDIETKTSALLTNHFDGEIQVTFEVEATDKLDVTIQKSGNMCSFSQLSKGQRCMLKLAFGVSVMEAVSNHHGVSFRQLFFDEALDGLDDQMKMKALRLLETLALSYESIFLVEHNSEIKAMLSNSYSVELVNGESKIEKT